MSRILDNSSVHSKWELVGYNGVSPGLENAVKRWSRLIGLICFSVYFDASLQLSPMIEFTASSIEAKCNPDVKYKQACEKRTSELVKSPYGVGLYCDMSVSPSRSHLLWFHKNSSPRDMYTITLEREHLLALIYHSCFPDVRVIRFPCVSHALAHNLPNNSTMHTRLY